MYINAFDVCVTVYHWYKNINSQLDTTIKNFIDNNNQLNMFRAIISPILRSTILCLQLVVQCTDDAACCWPGWGGSAVPPHPGHQQAALSVHYTTSCKHSIVLLRMGEIIARNMLTDCNYQQNLLFLHLVGCLYYFIHTHFQTMLRYSHI